MSTDRNPNLLKNAIESVIQCAEGFTDEVSASYPPLRQRAEELKHFIAKLCEAYDDTWTPIFGVPGVDVDLHELSPDDVAFFVASPAPRVMTATEAMIRRENGLDDE